MCVTNFVCNNMCVVNVCNNMCAAICVVICVVMYEYLSTLSGVLSLFYRWFSIPNARDVTFMDVCTSSGQSETADEPLPERGNSHGLRLPHPAPPRQELP